MFKNIFNEWASRFDNVQNEDYDTKKDDDMNPTSHVKEKDGKFCVYNAKGEKVKEFDTKPEADAYAKKNHDALMKEALDPVDKKELKGKHKDRKDKDIDNDGDVDSTDKYLHKRRKAVSKAMKKGKDKEGDVEMNPKLDKGSKENSMEQKESTIREKLLAVLENKQTKGATKPETMDDQLKGKGAKDMVNQPKEVDDTEEKGHDDASKAGKVTKPAKGRNGGDQVRSGDQNIVNKVVDALKGMK